MQDDFERAMVDPAALFATPEALLQRNDYSGEQKRLILGRWLQGAEELSVAEEEAWWAGSRR
jgi:hypothetical protein